MRIAFCQTVKDRKSQMIPVLEHNIKIYEMFDKFKRHIINTTYEYSECDISFNIVEWDCPDLSGQYILEKYSKYISIGAINLFVIKNQPFFHCPKAKNVAHKLGILMGADYLVNLDIDNYITFDEIIFIMKMAQHNKCCHMWAGRYDDGTYGKIGLPSEIFEKIGMYNESFPQAGAQDDNLLYNIKEFGYDLQFYPSTMKAIKNSKLDTIKHTNIKTIEEWSMGARFVKNEPFRKYETFSGILYHKNDKQLITL